MEDEEKLINTRICSGDDPMAIKEACAILNNGDLVAFPTETVYGLGGNALDPGAASKIYNAKGRPSDNPLIVHIANTEDVYKLAKEVPDKAVMLMEAFWPGPLTIILPKKDIVPDTTTGGLPTVAIRMPSHPVALNLIRTSGLYIAAPSANTSGRPSPTTVAHVAEDMTGKIPMILDGGAVGIGIESTIVDLTGDTPTILRPGFVTKSMLKSIVGEVSIDPSLITPDKNIRPKAPGMKYTHYAPKGELSIIEGNFNDIITFINSLTQQKTEEGYKVAVITTDENAPYYIADNIFIAGNRQKDETIAANLYAVLRKCDESGIDYIYSEAFNEGELGGAIMNRLLKAAGHRVITV